MKTILFPDGAQTVLDSIQTQRGVGLIGPHTINLLLINFYSCELNGFAFFLWLRLSAAHTHMHTHTHNAAAPELAALTCGAWRLLEVYKGCDYVSALFLHL